MTPVERLRAAIEKLEEMRAVEPIVLVFSRAGMEPDTAAWFERAEVKLAMFHRTLTVHLALLRREHDAATTLFAGMISHPDATVVALADAILGEA